MSDLKQLLDRLMTWREQRRLWKSCEKRAEVQTLESPGLQLQQEKLLQRRYKERQRLEKKIHKSKTRDDYVS